MTLLFQPEIQITYEEKTRVVNVYVCDESRDKIFVKIFSREELNHDEFIFEVEVESSDDGRECNGYLFSL